MGSTGAARGGGGRRGAERGNAPAPVTPARRRSARPAVPGPAPGYTRGQAVSREDFERATGRSYNTGRRLRRGR